MNGLNSQLTPAWRGREAAIHVNQPTCSYVVQNKVMFCSSSYQRPDKTPVFMRAQVQSLKKKETAAYDHHDHYSAPEGFIIGSFRKQKRGSTQST